MIYTFMIFPKVSKKLANLCLLLYVQPLFQVHNPPQEMMQPYGVSVTGTVLWNRNNVLNLEFKNWIEQNIISFNSLNLPQLCLPDSAYGLTSNIYSYILLLISYNINIQFKILNYLLNSWLHNIYWLRVFYYDSGQTKPFCRA